MTESWQASAHSAARIKEMLDVLRKHNLIAGLNPEKLRLILEDLGPTFIKMGQIMSMRPDILPKEYCDELKKLRSEVKPLAYEEIIHVIEHEYNLPINEVFKTIDPEPLGSASIAQVHAAILKNGKKVVAKVQRPGIYDVMAQDVALLRRAASLVKTIGLGPDSIDFRMLIDEMWAAALQEMDFLMEANHMKEFKRLNSGIEYIYCLHVEDSLTTPRILVMEYAEGIQIDFIDQLVEAGYDMNEIGMNLIRNYTKQIMEDGFFHADPHPGNIRIHNGKIIWLDMGMMGRLSKNDREMLKKMIIAIMNDDTLELKSAILSIGVAKGKINHPKLNADLDDLLSKYTNIGIGNLNVGDLIQEILDLSKSHNIGPSPGFSLLARGLITIEGVIRFCSPDVSFIEIISDHIYDSLLENFDLQKELLATRKSIIFSSKKAIDIPAQLSNLLMMTLKGQTKINLDITGSDETIGKFERIFNKLSFSIVCAALIIGSSIIAASDMTPKMRGFPFWSIIGYTFAAIVFVWLIMNISRKK